MRDVKNVQDGGLFQTLLATAADGIIVIDALGRVQIYNAACERLFGYLKWTPSVGPLGPGS
jgi:two-component system sensor kinase FixL